MDYSALEKRIAYTFKQEQLLRRAMTHKSFSADNNERLEFLGDTVLNSLIGVKLYQAFPKFDEGRLSKMRASLVNGEALGALAKEINLGDYLRLGKGEQRSGGRDRVSVLEDAFEALIGAVFLDSDWPTTETLIDHLFDPVIKSINLEAYRNYKSELQELMQSQRKPLPDYDIEKVTGQEHCQTFFVTCRVKGVKKPSRGEGSSRKKAEQKAAKQMLEVLKKND